MAKQPTQPEPDAVEPDGDTGREISSDSMQPEIVDENNEELGEISGGGEVTDLGGDSPSS